ncbi:MAG: DUF99 family protein [Deltaproteobacteria bacterium]|nr:DUF99 family protein [Deltaproteobacteria bacterium]
MNVIGFDDGPFPRDHRGDVLLVGVVCSGTRVDGIVSGRIRRDGANATREMVKLVRESQFGEHLQAVMLQGIAVGGFNVVDVHALQKALRIPVLIVTRRLPDLASVRRALFADAPAAGSSSLAGRPRVAGAARKWRLIEQAGALERLEPSRRSMKKKASGLTTSSPRLFIQRAGLSLDEARRLVHDTTLHGNIPEPLRLAHLIAGGVTTGKSRGRA